VPLHALNTQLEYVLVQFHEPQISSEDFESLWVDPPKNAFQNNTAGISFGLIKDDTLRIEAYGNYKNMVGVDQVMIMIVVLATQQVLEAVHADV